MIESRIKISDHQIRIKSTDLEPHPWNFERTPETTEEKEEWIHFKASVWRDGVWADKPILISKEKNNFGKYYILRGRRRWKAIVEGIKKGKVDSGYKIPAVHLLSDSSTLHEAIYGDNDTPLKYKPKDRYRIIKERWGIDAILEVNAGGSRKGKVIVKRSLADVIHEAIPSWSKHTINHDLLNLRKILKGELDGKKYPDLSAEKIESLNRQVLSWWERKRKVLRLEEELEEVKQGYKEKINEISSEISLFSKGFPIAGGPERYIQAHINSKRQEFHSLKEIKGLKEYLKKKEKT